MVQRTFVFKEDSCDKCGLCFNLCLVMHLPLERAKEEINKLIKEDNSSFILSHCNTCMSCNLHCPNGANPYQLILERWNDLYRKRGLPPMYRFVCPTETPNIWQLLNSLNSKKERDLINTWMSNVPEKNKPVLLIGSYFHLFPFIIEGSKLLEYFTLLDPIDLWEGGAYLYQGGVLDLTQTLARKTKNIFDKWEATEIVCSTDSVEIQYNEKHPKEFGVEYKQKFSGLNKWLLDKMKEGEILLPLAPLNMIVTVHDNCYSKVNCDLYQETPRKILELCGCDIIEMRHNHEDSLCCGFGAGASWVKNMSMPFDIISETQKRFREAVQTGAKALVGYCSGCFYLLWAARELLQLDIDVYHVIEIVRMAMGEKLNYPHDHIKRAWDTISIITYQLLISTFQKNFFIGSLFYKKDKKSFLPGKQRLLKLIRRAFSIKIVQKIYAKLFQMMIPMMKKK